MLSNETIKQGGAGVVVGICDTGLNRDLACFEGVKIAYKAFGQTASRHGTLVASTILSIAPKAELVFAGGIMNSIAKLQRMLEWISTYKLDVLNLSLAFPELDPAVDDLLRKLNEKDVLIFCARARDGNRFPWSAEYTISAGIEGNFESPSEWLAVSNSGIRTYLKGASASTALASGLATLMRSENPILTREQFLSNASPTDIQVPKKYPRQVNLKL